MTSSRGITLPEVLVVIIVLLVLMALLPVSTPISMDSVRATQAKNDVVQIAIAATAFESEYGYLPGTHSGAVDSHVLAALTGSNKIINPRQIVFLEVPPAKNGRSGVTYGTFVDPWGGAYQIAFAEGTNTHVTAGTNGVEVPKRVAVWNDPRLEKLDKRWFFEEKPKSRYVTSWK